MSPLCRMRPSWYASYGHRVDRLRTDPLLLNNPPSHADFITVNLYVLLQDFGGVSIDIVIL